MHDSAENLRWVYTRLSHLPSEILHRRVLHVACVVQPLMACLSYRSRCLQQMRGRLGDNWERISRMSIIEEGYGGEKCACCPVLIWR